MHFWYNIHRSAVDPASSPRPAGPRLIARGWHCLGGRGTRTLLVGSNQLTFEFDAAKLPCQSSRGLFSNAHAPLSVRDVTWIVYFFAFLIGISEPNGPETTPPAPLWCLHVPQKLDAVIENVVVIENTSDDFTVEQVLDGIDLILGNDDDVINKQLNVTEGQGGKSYLPDILAKLATRLGDAGSTKGDVANTEHYHAMCNIDNMDFLHSTSLREATEAKMFEGCKEVCAAIVTKASEKSGCALLGMGRSAGSQTASSIRPESTG